MNKFYKDIEQLTYYVYHESTYDKPEGWKSIKVYKNPRNGFYAETFENKTGEKVFVIRGTDTEKGLKELIKDINNNIKLATSKIPQQAHDAYLAYEDFTNKYGNTTIAGYSLGGSLTQIVCTETGAKGITFAAYGVGDFITPKHTDNIINFGNECDPVYIKNIDNHIGKVYVIPNNPKVDKEKVYISETKYDIKNAKNFNLFKHFPGNNGDVADAIEYFSTPFFKISANYDYYSDNTFTPSNRVFHSNEIKFNDVDNETGKEYVNQFYENNYKMPKKEDLDRRVRFGELIYVEGYIRSDGTKVSGYYRRYPKK